MVTSQWYEKKEAITTTSREEYNIELILLKKENTINSWHERQISMQFSTKENAVIGQKMEIK